MSANAKLLEKYVELYNSGYLDSCMDLYAEDAVQLMHDGIFEGRSEIHTRLARDLTAFPDATYTVVSFVEQGDSFADEWTFVGTHTGSIVLPDGTELPPTGKRIEIRGMEIVELRVENDLPLVPLKVRALEPQLPDGDVKNAALSSPVFCRLGQVRLTDLVDKKVNHGMIDDHLAEVPSASPERPNLHCGAHMVGMQQRLSVRWLVPADD